MQIEYKRKAVKYINSCDTITKKRLKEAIEKIPSGDIKKLQGYDNDYRLRVGDLRVLFEIADDTITIKDIAPRGQVYKKYRRDERMSRETIKNMINFIPEEDIDTIYKVLIRFIPEDKPSQDEIEAIEEANADKSPTISHNEINWD